MDEAQIEKCTAAIEQFAALSCDERSLPKYKRIRTLLYPIATELAGKYHRGEDPVRVQQNAAEKRYIHAKRQREQGALLQPLDRLLIAVSTPHSARDMELLNSRQLRAARLERLATLTTQTGIDGLIADGVADTNTSTRMLAIDANDEPVPELHESRSCYICRGRYRQLHHFYDSLCSSCAILNYKKRSQTADLNGFVAVVTGARVKIGYQVALKLLRCGASVIATTRFPVDASIRFSSEHDASEWKDRLQIVGLDFRDVLQVERCARVMTLLGAQHVWTGLLRSCSEQ